MPLVTEEITYLAEVAETIRDDAIATSYEKYRGAKAEDVARLLESPGFLDLLKYEVAVRVADVLGAADGRVQAVYLRSDTNLETDAYLEVSRDATVPLIVEVGALTTAGLESWIASLDFALVESFRHLESPTFAQREFLLDVTMVSSEEAEFGLGNGSLIWTPYVPPIRVWPRNER